MQLTRLKLFRTFNFVLKGKKLNCTFARIQNGHVKLAHGEQ